MPNPVTTELQGANQHLFIGAGDYDQGIHRLKIVSHNSAKLKGD